MQTYEIAPGESLDYVAQAMRLLAQEDPEMLIRVPLNADPIDGPYAAERLHSALLGVTTRVLVQAADPQTVAWLQEAGFEAEPLLGGMPPAPPPPPAAPAPAAQGAAAPAEEGAAADAPGWSPRVAWTPSGPPAAPAPPPPPAPGPPAEKQGFLQKLWNAVAPPVPPPPPAPAAPEPFAAAMAAPPPGPPPMPPPMAPPPAPAGRRPRRRSRPPSRKARGRPGST